MLQYESETSSTKVIVAEQFLEAGQIVKNKKKLFVNGIATSTVGFLLSFPHNGIPVF